MDPMAHDVVRLRSRLMQPGTTLGRYLIESLLGQGGMGQVYRAQDTTLHRRVALKILLAPRGDEAQWEEAKTRMLREARAAAALEHPNAVGIYDLGEVDGTPYIAMEYVPGKGLHEYVGDPAIAWETKLRWLLDAAAALAAAHEAGIVHRDVKPENVRIRDDGRVKVLDFGIARRVAQAPSGTEPTLSREAAPQPTLTGQGMIIGTLQYMPPEQLAGKPLDGRADQFAWGVMAYELFAGETPWPGHADVIATVTAILSTPPPALFARAPQLPPAVAEAIERTLSKTPEGRFDSMPELIAALEPYAAPPTSLASVPPRSGSASSIPVIPRASSASGVNPLGPTSVRPGTDGALTLEAGRRAPTRRRPWVLGAAAGVVLLAAAGLGGAILARRGPATAGSSSASASSSSGSAPAAPTSLSALDLPAPVSTSTDALTAYREGMQAWHDANLTGAQDDFLHAATADPALGAAHLRYALMAFYTQATAARTHFLKAQQLRKGLGEHEEILLDAMAPMFEHHPADWAEAERRLVAATQARPYDAELFYQLAWVRLGKDSIAESREACKRALAIDPHYGAALYALERAGLHDADADGAISASDECLKVAPQAASCVHLRLSAEALAGRCKDYDEDAHRLLAIDPESNEGYEDLAMGGFALGHPLAGIREAEHMAWKHSPPDDAAWGDAQDRAAVAELAGDRRGLEEALKELEQHASDRTDAYDRMNLALTEVGVWTELGALDRAARAADTFLSTRDTLAEDEGLDEFALVFDDQPIMFKALARAGKITPAELDRRRGAWIDSWRPRLDANIQRYLWLYGYAEIVDTAADAAKALDALPAFAPLPRYRPSLDVDAHVGHTYLLAGRADEAVPYLRAAAAQCNTFEDPIAWVHASLWLGQALEAKGQKDDACDAYRSVATRWSGFGRSSSAQLARRRIAALRCSAH
jgi:serine/threonine-protein kinase